jgi:hypothetical protein
MQDSHIPFVLACTTASGEHLQSLVKKTVNRESSQLDVVPLILRLLTPSKQLSKQLTTSEASSRSPVGRATPR